MPLQSNSKKQMNYIKLIHKREEREKQISRKIVHVLYK